MRHTRSVCPVCLKPIVADLIEKEEIIYMEKCCPEHGAFSMPVWYGKLDMDAWREGTPELSADNGLHCPENCGILKSMRAEPAAHCWRSQIGAINIAASALQMAERVKTNPRWTNLSWMCPVSWKWAVG